MSGHRGKRRRQNIENDESVGSDDAEVPVKRSHDESDASTSKEVEINESKSNEKATDELVSGEPEDDNNSLLATCRLRTGLNEDCLCEVFRFLGVYDLIQLCELDIYFQNLIIRDVIGIKLINFTKMDPCWTTNKIFQVFGKAMRKIKIAEENTLGCFERFLTFVTQHCAIGGLTEVELRFSEPIASPAIMAKSMPYFSNLRKLVLNDNYQRVHYMEFLAGIAETATNLTHLTLEGVNVSGEWLKNGGMENLKELRLHTSKRRSLNIQNDELAVFLRTKAKLEIFSHISSCDITDVIDSLVENCPKLKSFADFHLKEVPVTTTGANMTLRYGFVRRFFGVTTLGITSYTRCGSDLYYPLVKLAARNRVETLKIYVDRNNCAILDDAHQMSHSRNDFAHFTRLRSIELQIRSDATDQCELNAEFICDFVSKQPNVQAFTVISEPALKDIHKILDKAPHLTELGISHTKMKYLPVEMRKIVRSIRKRHKALIAEGIAEPEPFHLVVNLKQWREVQVYDDVNIILETTVDGNDDNQSFNIIGV